MSVQAFVHVCAYSMYVLCVCHWIFLAISKCSIIGCFYSVNRLLLQPEHLCSHPLQERVTPRLIRVKRRVVRWSAFKSKLSSNFFLHLSLCIYLFHVIFLISFHLSSFSLHLCSSLSVLLSIFSHHIHYSFFCLAF